MYRVIYAAWKIESIYFSGLQDPAKTLSTLRYFFLQFLSKKALKKSLKSRKSLTKWNWKSFRLIISQLDSKKKGLKSMTLLQLYEFMIISEDSFINVVITSNDMFFNSRRGSEIWLAFSSLIALNIHIEFILGKLELTFLVVILHKQQNYFFFAMEISVLLIQQFTQVCILFIRLITLWWNFRNDGFIRILNVKCFELIKLINNYCQRCWSFWILIFILMRSEIDYPPVIFFVELMIIMLKFIDEFHWNFKLVTSQT